MIFSLLLRACSYLSEGKGRLCFFLPIFAIMQINLSDKEIEILKKVATAAKNISAECYAIGGFVRDKILGRDTKDIDVVCIGDGILLAEETAKLFSPKPTVNIFKTYGTAQIKFETDEIEFVGARKESYTSDSRNPTVEKGTLEEDQLRRDFTINAMGISLNEESFGTLLDPFDGLGDIEKKILRTPLEPTQTFIDDPLRMMRAIRFATQLQFTIEENTLQAIAKNANRIKIITTERISDELNKILLSKKPSIGFDLLYKTGLLQIIFPQFVALAGAEFVDGYGHKDNFYHTLQVVDNICETTDDLWLRWAAVLHDIAKPNTKKFEEGHGWTFHGHEVVGGRMVPKIFAQLKLPQNEKMRFVRKMVELHLRPISLTKENITDSAIRRLLFDAGEDIDSLMKLCNADITSKNKQKVKRFLENFEMVKRRCIEVEESDSLRNWQPPITGEIIMETFKLPPSKPVGLLKDAIRNAILDGEIPNNYEAAYTYMLAKAEEIGVKVN
jgi:poly(A) polymerase